MNETPELFGIGQAVNSLREGRCVARLGWNGKGQHLFLVGSPIVRNLEDPAGEQADFEQFVAISPGPDRKPVPWICSQTDLLAFDWHEVLP